MRLTLLQLALLGLLVAPLAGCGGGDSSSLTGKVTYNGAPVEAGSVTFMPEGSGTPFGGIIVDGAYTAEKVNAGKFRALVKANAVSTGPLTREQAAEMAKAPSPNYIPENAAGNAQSVEVTGGGQVLDFTITGPPRP